MNTNLNTTEIVSVLAALEESNTLGQRLLALIGHDVELTAKTTTAAQFLADLTAPAQPEPEPVVTASEPVVTEPEANPNKVLAAWLRANGFEANGEAWAVSKALVRDGMAPQDAVMHMLGTTTCNVPDLSKIPVTVDKTKTTSTPKAPKTPKAKAPKKVHPPIACADCGAIVPEPTWNQRYCATHSAERKNVFQTMLDQRRAAAK